MALPELPVSVPTDQVQKDGKRDGRDIYQTQRGKAHRDDAGPTVPNKPDVALRWEDA